MNEKKIEITVNPEGAVSMKTTGFTGKFLPRGYAGIGASPRA